MLRESYTVRADFIGRVVLTGCVDVLTTVTARDFDDVFVVEIIQTVCDRFVQNECQIFCDICYGVQY